MDICADMWSKPTTTTERFTMQIPSEFETMIAEKYIDQLIMLNNRFHEHTDQWLAEAKKVLE